MKTIHLIVVASSFTHLVGCADALSLLDQETDNAYEGPPAALASAAAMEAGSSVRGIEIRGRTDRGARAGRGTQPTRGPTRTAILSWRSRSTRSA